MALSKTTQDHDEIRQWAEARGGKPAEVASTSETGTGILRIEFPGATNANDSNLKEIGWDEFFEKFDASSLSLVYQDVTAEGAQSNFSKLIHPETPGSSARKSTRKTVAKKAAPVKKTAGRPPAAAKKTAAKKTTGSKTAAKKPAAKKTTVKASLKKTAAKKTAAKKTTAKKTTAKKTATKSATAKKTATKKSAAKSSVSRKSPAKKTTAKKSSAKKTTKAGAQRAAIAIKKKTAVKKGGRR